ELSGYGIAAAPAEPRKRGTEMQAAGVIQGLISQLGASERHAHAAIGGLSSLVAEIEMPRTAADELRSAVSLNGMRYLRRDLSGYYVDAAELVPTEGGARRSATMRVLVAAAPKDEVLWCRDVLTAVRLKVETIQLAAVAVMNAFLSTHGEICRQHVVLLLDIGHTVSSMSFLKDGLPVLTRLVPFGGTQVADRVAQAMGLAVGDIERMLQAQAGQVRNLLRESVAPLAREIRASVDFVERQHDCEIEHAYAGGGIGANEVILGILSEEAGVAIRRLNPLEGCVVGDKVAATVQEVAPVLAAAVGVAVTAL
ncbi:MAG: pilus assembly protein PilM, partial [Verrucomicrobiae bacterium]|nr:pilus assembly protein PilM [Verrucomicrobiae bacterium]